MNNIADERKRLLIKVCNLYYMEGLNQQEIADRLHISRPQISRMLSAAKAEGIVNITIKNPYVEEQQYESAIADTFGIKDVIIVNTENSDPRMVERQLADAGAALLESIIKDNDIIGVMAGRTICALGEEIEYFPRKGLSFVPLIGGWGHEGTNWHANANTSTFGEKLRSKYYILNAPAVVASKEARDMLMNEREISEVLNLARRSSVALIGIGQVTQDAAIVKSGYFSGNDIEEVKSNGAVANICTSFINKNGDCIKFSAESRMIGMTIEEIRKIPQVIAIASGPDKVEAVAATLRGRWIDVLVTNMSTARAVLELQRIQGADE